MELFILFKDLTDIESSTFYTDCDLNRYKKRFSFIFL